MIIWRGWGIIGFLIPLACAGLMAALGSELGMDNPAILVALGVMLGGVGAFVTGRWFNETRAVEESASYMEGRNAELQHLIARGQFQLAPGYAQPRSMAEAQAQASAILQSEQAQVSKAFRNRHTVFWIPMQWFGVVVAVLGAGFAVVSLLGG